MAETALHEGGEPATSGLDANRRHSLLVEARRKRNAWVEDARDGSLSAEASSGYAHTPVAAGSRGDVDGSPASKNKRPVDSAVDILVDRSVCRLGASKAKPKM